MNVFKELEEVDEIKDNLELLTDNILKRYNSNPEKSKSLLLELVSIKKELEDIENDFKKLC
jgi:predicted  nucleic acid-binding Zn-ribbon protein